MIVWITTLTDKYEDIIISSLVKQGFTVRVAAENTDSVSMKSPLSCLIALDIFNKKYSHPYQAHEIVLKILEENKIIYHNVIISEAIESAWRSGNCVLPERKIIKPNHLKLVKESEKETNNDDKNPV